MWKLAQTASLTVGLYPAVCFRPIRGEYETVGGPSSVRRPQVEARRTKLSRAGRGLEGGVPFPSDRVQGYHPRENFEISDTIWCNLVDFGKKLTFLQFLADLTNGRVGTVLRLSSVTRSVVAKRCVLEQKLLLRAYRKSYMRNE